MPEPVELRVRGRERRRVAVAEPDDRDPGAEVEVRAAVVVPEPAPVAADEREVGARVGRQHRRARVTGCHLGAHAVTARRADLGRARRSRAARTAAQQLRARCRPRRRPSASIRSASSAAMRRTTPPSTKHAGDVRDEQDALGAEADGERGRGLVGVHVQRPGGERRDDGDQAGGERRLDGGRRGSARRRRRARAPARAPPRGRSRRPAADARAGRSPRRARR